MFRLSFCAAVIAAGSACGHAATDLSDEPSQPKKGTKVDSPSDSPSVDRERDPEDSSQATDEMAGTMGTVMGVAGADAPNVVAGTGEDTPAGEAGVTYHKDIRPVLEQNCLSCHIAGGVGPFPLDSWEAVQDVAGPVALAVISGHMPPWPARDDCHPMRGVRALDEATRALFPGWQANDFAEGDPADYKARPALVVEGRDLGPATLTLKNREAYTPLPKADDYHCFVLEHVFESDTYLTAMDILPDQRAEVHHVQIHRLDADELAAVQALDAASPEPGYTCTAGTGVASQNMFSWRPGSERVTFDEGDGAFVEAGSSLVIQVHYNTLFLPDDSAPTPDQTSIALWTLPDGELPDYVIYRKGVTAPFDIPAGDPAVLATNTVAMGEVSTFGSLSLFGGGTFVPGEIVGMTPHAHQIASMMSASLLRSSGETACLVDVPEWDFHWQLDYMFKEGVPYTETDTITANCQYDNSAANQPVVNGQQQAPRNVTWGEGSLDEMCLHYVWLKVERGAFLAARQ